jgi:hypothetical protein
VAVTAALTVTSRLRVGSGICLVVERDPITTAKEVASVDYLSGGRFEFGVGAGWNREEMANHGTDPRRRMAVMRERVEAMKAIWTCDEASYAGEHVTFERIWSWPTGMKRRSRNSTESSGASAVSRLPRRPGPRHGRVRPSPAPDLMGLSRGLSPDAQARGGLTARVAKYPGI